MPDETFFGGDRLGDSHWTLDRLIEDAQGHVIVVGRTLHYIAMRRDIFRPLLFGWLEQDPDSRALDIVICDNLSSDFVPAAQDDLVQAKQVFWGWSQQARSQATPLALHVHSVGATILMSATIVDPDAAGGVIVLPLHILQPIAGERPFIVIQRSRNPGSFASIWGQIQVVWTRSKPLAEPPAASDPRRLKHR